MAITSYATLLFSKLNRFASLFFNVALLHFHQRFRNIVAFSEKLDASKCNGCRERGRRSYLQRKGVGPFAMEGEMDDELETPGETPCSP